ncbi:integron [Methyloligella solikamskensis]|uniref:Integron n=1 Tax=Methyloligella solikamskensis TaxID=1177756 RepID=A0ABW3J873_9HYPH
MPDCSVISQPRRAWLLAAALAPVILAGAAFAELEPIPVMAGQDGAGSDACGSWGQIVGLADDPDAVLPVRAGPGPDYPVVDEIRQGQGVSMCDRKENWEGIVYSKQDQTCGVGTPWPEPRAYSGPCKSGWVEHKYVDLVAG